MPKIFKISLLTFSVLLVFFAFAGQNLRSVRADEGVASAYRQINVYSEVLQRIQSDYVVDPNIDSVTNGALRGLLESLDSDSSYLTAADYTEYKKGPSGHAQVGLNVAKRFGYATVVSVVAGSPADKANLNDGDIIESIGATSTRDIAPAMIRAMLEGQPGTPVTVSVIRPQRATPEKVTLTRTNVQLGATADTQYENNSIVQLKPTTIDKERVQEIEQRLKAMQKAGNRKILLDLRDVSTGDVNQAVKLANLFLAKGTIATLEGQKFAKQTYTADPGKAVNTTAPLAVLVNHGTAGPSEIVAAAILDNKRGDVVGEKTFGEGVQQKTIELPEGAALILTIAKYQTPAGKVIEDEGITPTLVVASHAEMAMVDEDEEEAPAPAAAAPAAKPAPAQPKMDDQLTKALDVLKLKS
ncbi:MAG TPA: S41 family peptidase [Acidobacteriaceae bacterium]